MADHGEVEYATAEGNDLPAHEANYVAFTHFAVIGTVYVINILVGLAIGGVLGHWLLLAAVIIAGDHRGRRVRVDGIAHSRCRRARPFASHAAVLLLQLTPGPATQSPVRETA